MGAMAIACTLLTTPAVRLVQRLEARSGSYPAGAV